MARIKKVKVHSPIGVYEHSDDNAPLEELANNDVILQERVDAAYVKLQDSLDVGFTREGYVPLQPEQDGSKVYVNPGTFLCRMPVRSGPFEGVGRGAGLNTRRGGLDSDKDFAEPENFTDFHRMGESQRSSVIFFNGGYASFDAWKEEDFNYDRLGADWVPDEPNHRLDLVCIQGFPASDQFGKNPTVLSDNSMEPKLVVVKGAGFRNTPILNGMYAEGDENITWSPNWGDNIGVDKYRATLLSNSEGITKAKTYGMGMTSVERFSSDRTYGTTPAPDDIINSSFHIMPGLVDEYFTPILSGTEEQSKTQAAVTNKSHVGLFCVPVAYVRIPKGYSGGNIRKEWVVDIRPFFRSAELTLPERQAIANSYLPEASNRFLSVFDSDYQALVDYVMREDQWNVYELDAEHPHAQRNIVPGNHEGRIRAMEAAASRPRFQVAPRQSSSSRPLNFYDPIYPKENPYYQPPWAMISKPGPNRAMNAVSPGYEPISNGLSYQAGLVMSKGQYIPCVRNYLDRFYTDSWNYHRLYKELDFHERQNYGSRRMYGAHSAICRRLVNRKWFLNYNSSFANGRPSSYEGGEITEYPARMSRLKNMRQLHGTFTYNPQGPAKIDLGPNNMYKLQMIEVDFEFPNFNTERDAHDECEEVWSETCSRGKGWSGFGHGGSVTCDGKYITKCVTLGAGKTVARELPYMGIPLGFAPYWIDVDALGFAPGSIDCLQIQVANCLDTKNDFGTFIMYRFCNRPPSTLYRNIGQPYTPTIVRQPDSKYLTLDERERKLNLENGQYVFDAVGEHHKVSTVLSQERREGRSDLPTEFIIKQISPGYNGFVLMTNMPIVKRSWSESGESNIYHHHMSSGWNGHSHKNNYTINYVEDATGHKKKRCKLKITGPAHRYYNGAFLPAAGYSDSGDAEYGDQWID
jgi:hypothetical protein